MSNASEYADSLAADIRAMSETGSPFGWLNSQTDEWIDYYPSSKPNFHDGIDNWQEASAGDYLSDALDIEYIVTSDRQFKAARILVAFGGPTAWINTHTSQLEVAWWSASEYRPLPGDFIDGLDDYLSEMWEMGA